MQSMQKITQTIVENSYRIENTFLGQCMVQTDIRTELRKLYINEFNNIKKIEKYNYFTQKYLLTVFEYVVVHIL